MRGWLALVLGCLLVLPAGTVQAADTFRTQMDWREGTFLAGTFGAGESLFPEATPAPDHARLGFDVSPCHRDLEIDLLYEPAGAGVDTEKVTAQLPYRFRISLYDPAGERLERYVVDEPDHGLPLGTVDETGHYTVQLELIEGANVHWETRVQGWAVDDPSCGLWVNEVEANPPGLDITGEWVEIHHDGEAAFDLSDWYVEAAGTNRTLEYEIPSGTSVPSDGFAVVDLPGQLVPDENVSLSLVPPVGGAVDGSPRLDDTRDGDGTQQRVPDGASSWLFAEATPGTSNGS